MLGRRGFGAKLGIRSFNNYVNTIPNTLTHIHPLRMQKKHLAVH